MDINNHVCDRHTCDRSIHNSIRPSSSLLVGATSWSLGLGADPGDDGPCCDKAYDNQDESNSDDDDDDDLDENQLEGRFANGLSLSSSLPVNSGAINRSENRRCQCKQPRSMREPVGNIPPPCPRIFVDIPTVFLTKQKDSKSNSSSFHVYQLNFSSSKSAKWSVYRRYSQFLSLHQRLKSIEPMIGKFSFPPKRRLNSKASTIVQDRRQRLEEYMRKLCEFLYLMPLVGLADSSSYKKLTDLATNGPSQPKPPIESTCPETESTQNTEASSSSLEPTTRGQSVGPDDLCLLTTSGQSSVGQSEDLAQPSGSGLSQCEEPVTASILVDDEQWQAEQTILGGPGRYSRSSSQTTNVTQATTVDDTELSDGPCCHSSIARSSPLSIGNVNSSRRRILLNKKSAKKNKSVRYLFYEFISPKMELLDMEDENEFEQQQFELN